MKIRDNINNEIQGSVKPTDELSYDTLSSYIERLKNNSEAKGLEVRLKALSKVIEWAKNKQKISDQEYHKLVHSISNFRHDKALKVTKPSLVSAGWKERIIKHRKTLVICGLVGFPMLLIVLILLGRDRTPIQNEVLEVNEAAKYIHFTGSLSGDMVKPGSEVDLTFHLYDAKDATRPVYTGTCYGEDAKLIDTNGQFSVTIGSDCQMAPLTSEILNSKNLYLGIQVNDSKEMKPRYPIVGVDYSLNAERVKGLQVGSNALNIPYIDQEGVFKIEAVSPIIKSVNGDFVIEGENLILKNPSESSGSIILQSSEQGAVSITSSILEVGNDIHIGGDVLLNADSQIGSENKSIQVGEDSSYKIGLGAAPSGDGITLALDINPFKNGMLNLGSNKSYFNAVYTKNLVLPRNGIGGYWQQKDSIMTPTNSESTIVIGSTKDNSGTVTLSSDPQGSSWFKNRRLGVGTENPLYAFSALDSRDENSAISLSNFSRTDKSATNVLKLNLGAKGSEANFISFYAGATTEANGTNVGNIGLFNNQLAFKTAGADFAEYVIVQGKPKPGIIVGNSTDGLRNGQTDDIPIGVVTDSAGVIGNYDQSDEANATLVGFIGQIETYVSTINGEIRPGDAIALSSIPGYGVRSSGGQMVVGTVIDSKEQIASKLTKEQCPKSIPIAASCGRVTVLISPFWYPESNKEDSSEKHVGNEDNKSTYIVNIGDQSNGKTDIPAGYKEVKLYGTRISNESVILLTPVSQSSSIILTIHDQHGCDGSNSKDCRSYVTIGVKKTGTGPFSMNWLIIN